MKELLFIINPIAGGGKTKDVIPLINEIMKQNNIKYNIVLTKEPKDAIGIVEQSNYHTIIAVGGDGTVNEVAKGLIKRGWGTLGIIPSGTGNDMSKSLGIPLDSRAAILAIINGKGKEMDIGTANGNPFLNISSIGFDAEVVRTTNRIKTKIKGKAAYVLGVITTLLNYKKRDIELEIDGAVYKKKIILIAVGNGMYYGGGMKVLPMANIDDGYLDICVVKDMSNLKAMFLFPSIFKGNHLKYTKYVDIYRAKTIKVKSLDNICLNIDGELLDTDKEVLFKMEEYKLNIIHG